MKVRSEAQLDQLVGECQQPVFVKFFAPWCKPCGALTPRFEALASQLSGKAIFVSVDVDEIREAATKHGVHSVPTILMFNKGTTIGQLVGAKQQDQLKEWVDTQLAKL